MSWILAILAFLLTAILLRSLIVETQIRKLAHLLPHIGDEARYGSRLYFDCNNRAIARLALLINDLIDEYEAKLKSSAELEDNVRLSISCLSHDIRTPLTSLIGNVKLMKTAPVERHAEYLAVIEQSAIALRELNEKFYALSRLEQDKKDMQLSEIDLYRFVCDKMILYYEDFESRDIAVAIDEPKDLTPVLADAVAAERILTNLIQNILRYAARQAEVSFRDDGKYCFAVFENDTSVMPPLDVNSIFDRFRTGDVSRNARGGGLGLYICRNLIESMGGCIEAEKTKTGLLIRIGFLRASG